MSRLIIKSILFLFLSSMVSLAGTSDDTTHIDTEAMYKRFLEISKQVDNLKINGDLDQLPEGQFHLKIEMDALDSLLKDLPIPKKIEISGDHVRFDDDPADILNKYKLKHTTERKQVVKFGEDIIIGRNEWVNGDVVVFGGDATIYGMVKGGVIVMNGNIRLTSTSEIDKDIVCLWGNTDIDPGAHVKGETVVFNVGRFSSKLLNGPFMSLAQFAFRLFGIVLLLVIVIIIDIAFPKHITVIRDNFKTNYAKNFLTGFFALFLLPVIFILLIATVLGIPIALLLLPIIVLAAYLFGMTACYLVLGEFLQSRYPF